MAATRSRVLWSTAAVALLVLGGCGTDPGAGSVTSPVTSPVTSSGRSVASPRTTASPRTAAAQPGATYASPPVIVIDPGHSRTINAVDPSTGLVVSDYENEPEMRDVFSVATRVAAELRGAGYRVVLTKTSVDQRRDLAQRAQIANDAHADLAVSIHDQAGSNGGIGFRAGNNTVYYQSVGGYRATPSGRHVVFRNTRVAALSKRYGTIFAAERSRVQRAKVSSRGNVGYDLGSRGLAAGDMWMVQLLSRVPWIYNEAGGNSAGRVGLSTADEITYADALVASVERCVPPPLPATTAAAPTTGSNKGGTVVTVHGHDFRHVTAVYFGVTPSTRVKTLSPYTLRVLAPPHALGTTRIRVRTSNGLSTTTTPFTYAVS